MQTTFLYGQEIEFEHLSKSDGLPSNYVTSIAQDKYGMMWFGTFNGLVRFDGYSYKVFLHDEKDPGSVSDNLIRSLHILPDKRLLVATENYGIAILNYEDETFKRYMHQEGNKNSLSNNNIISVDVDSSGIVWIGTWGGINRFDPVKENFEFYQIKSDIDENLQDFISSITEENKDNLLLYVTGSRIMRFNRNTHFYENVAFPGLPKPKLRLNRGGILFLDKQGYIWIGTELNGLYRLDPRTNAVRNYNVSNGRLTSNILMYMLQDSKGRLWVATDGGGLLLYQYESDTFKPFRYDQNKSSSISGNAVYSIYEDRSGHIWAGTYAAGLNVIKNNKRKFEYYGMGGKEGYSLSYKSVLSFEKDKKGNIYIGTDGGGLNVFDPSSRKFTYYNSKNSRLPFDIVKSLYLDSKGNFWLGSYGNGLCKINFSKGEYRHFSPFEKETKNKISHVNVWSITEDKNANIWAGFLDAGISKFDPALDRFVSSPLRSRINSGLTDGSVLSSLIDKNNNLWIGTESGGLCFLDSSRKEFVVFKHSSDTTSLPSDNVWTIRQDRKGRIWVGTKDGGLSLLEDFKKGYFRNFTKKDGLAGNIVSSIEEDIHGNLWLGTDNGLSCFLPDQERFINFDKKDGLQSLEFAKSASLIDKDGYLYFGGTDGFNRFHPDSIQYNVIAPEVFISGINLFNKPLNPGVPSRGKIYYTKPVHLLDTLNLRYSDYVFSINFTCTDLTSPEKNQFAYMLEGFETEWNYVDASSRTSTYTNLEPGKYVFRVRASNNDGVWNNEGKSLVIIVSPPWYSSWWFKTLSCLLLVISLISFYYIRMNHIRKQNAMLSDLIRQRTSELENANTQLKIQNVRTISVNKQLEIQQKEILAQKETLEEVNLKLNRLNETKDKLFSIIGHDLRNPVSALTSLTGMLQQNYEVLGEKERLQIVEHIQASSTSLKILVTNLLNWALVQSNNLHPHPESVNLKKITDECFRLLKLHAIGKNISLVNSCSEEHSAYADTDMIQTVLRNLVSNAIKFTGQGGHISVSTAVYQNFIQLRISDTGSGMDQSKITKLLTRDKVISTTGTSEEKGSGIGLMIVKEFIEVNRGKLEISSAIGKGTTFIISLQAYHE